MSILSEAWRRAHSGDARLSKTLGAPAVSLRQRPPLLPWLLCGLLIALVAGLAVYIWLDRSRPPRPAPVLAVKAATPSAGKLAGAASQHLVSTPVSNKPRATRPAVRQASPTVKRQTAAVESAVTPLMAGGNADEKAHRDASTQEASTVDKASSPRPNPAAAAPTSKPIELTAAPDAVRTAFPSFDIVVHVWNADPASRFVVIGTRQFRAGDEIAPGVRLLKITRNGEIVGFRGYRLILP